MLVLSILAKFAGPQLGKQFSNFSFRILSDVPDLRDGWVVRFRDPFPNSTTRVLKIDAVLTQFGHRVRGFGHVQGEPNDPFEYSGTVRRNAFFGEFRRKNRSILAGTGTFVVKIVASGREMNGRCSWYDSDLDRVWSSRYDWSRWL